MQLDDQTISALPLEAVIDPHPLRISPEASLLEVLALMLEEKNTCPLSRVHQSRATILSPETDHSYVLVMDRGKLLGLITAQDFVRLAANRTNLYSSAVAEVMNRDVVTLQETHCQNIWRVLEVFQEHQIHYLPILDRDEQLVGIVTSQSIRSILQPTDLLRMRTVAEVMEQDVICVAGEISLLEIAQLMHQHQVSHVLIGEQPEVVGIITGCDLVQFQALELDFCRIQAQKVMSAPLFTVRVTDSLWSAHQAMHYQHVKRLIVTNERGNFVGLISQASIFEALDPLKMYSALQRLQDQVSQLQGEKLALLANRNEELSEQVKERSTKLQQQFESDRLLATIALRIRQSLDFEQILHTTVEEVQQLLQIERVLIYQLSSGGSGIVVAESVIPGCMSLMGNVIHDPCTASWGKAYTQGRINPVADIHQAGFTPCHVKFLEQLQIKANLVVPILLGDQLWGLLAAQNCSAPRLWQDWEVELLEKLATQVAIAIQQATLLSKLQTELSERQLAERQLNKIKQELEIRVEERTAQLKAVNEQLTAKIGELQERHQEMTLLVKVSDFLPACLTKEEAYYALPKLLFPLFPQTCGGVFVINNDSDLLELVANWGDELASQSVFSLGDCWALRRSRHYCIDQNNPGLRCQHMLKDPSVKESLCVPLMAQGKVLGLLYLNTWVTGSLGDAKRYLAATVGEHIAMALANLQLREELHRQSIRDPLTGLFNRRYLEESLRQALHYAKRKNQPLGIIMLDVDHFKRFNDTFGHEIGDFVLEQVGTYLQGSIRGSDIACRYGGEEIMLILPEASLENTRQRAEQLRLGIRGLNLQCHGQELGLVTVSLGVACFPEHGMSSETLFEAADKALYQAKIQGRDRTVCFS